jgi:cytosine deaminase
VVIGEATTFSGGHEWLAERGVDVVVLDDPECVRMMTDFIRDRPELWFEDIGQDDLG